jgi:predicted ATPase
VPHLLVIDNCEHVIDATASIATTLATRADRCRILCTSREPLGVADEQVYRVGPLSTLPVGTDATRTSVLDTPSGSLFDDRARRSDHTFELTDELAPAVAKLCRELDGLPLAIELAAGRVTTLGLDDLLDRLDRRLDLLVSSRRGVVDRHRTLRATVEWSYGAIGADAQRLLRYLSIFPAGVMLDTVEAIGRQLALTTDTIDLVSGLVEVSLLQRLDRAAGARYVQLETLKAFGLDRLDHHDERTHALDLAAAWALDLVARMNTQLLSEAEPAWAARMRSELPNLRVVRQHLVDADRVDDLVDLAMNLHEWARLRDVSEPWSWADELVPIASGRDEAIAGRVHAIASQGAWRRGEIERARMLATRALEIEQRHPDAWTRARARSELAVAQLFAGDVASAIESWLERVDLDPYAVDLANAAFATAYAGDVDRARDLVAQARSLASERKSPTCIAWAAYATGEIEFVAGSGNHGEWLARAIEIARTVGSDFTLGVAQVTLASSLAASGDLVGAATTYHRLIDHWLRTGSWTQQWTTLRNAAVLLEPHAPTVALAIILAAELDPFSPALSVEARDELDAVSRRLKSDVGDDRIAAITSLSVSELRLEVALQARDALESLT